MLAFFRRWGENSFSQNMCVLHQPAVDCVAQGGEAAMWPPGSEAWVDAAGQPAGVSLEPRWRLPLFPPPCLLPSPVQASMGLAPANGARVPCVQPLATWCPPLMMLVIVPALAPQTPAADKSHPPSTCGFSCLVSSIIP